MAGNGKENLEPIKAGVQVTALVTIEREGIGKPACIAEALSVLVP
ncbi:hypothetical protein ACQPXH_24165 [Nocardia sp. CA-135953]